MRPPLHRLFCVARDGADEFDKSGGDADENAGKIEPGRVQPAIEQRTDDPSYDGRGWKREGELAVAGRLNPEVAALRGGFLFVGAGIAGLRESRHLR